MYINPSLSRNRGLKSPGAKHGIHAREAVRISCYFIIALCDTLALVSSFLTANYIRFGTLSNADGLTFLAVMLPIYFSVASFNSAYGGEALARTRLSYSRAAQALAVAGAVVALVVYMVKASNELSRGVFLLGWSLAFATLPTVRLVLGRLLLKILGGMPYTTVVIVDGVDYRPRSDETVVSSDELGFDPETNDPMRFNSLSENVAHADRVLIATRVERYTAWSLVLKSMAVSGELISDEADPLGIVGIGQYGRRNTLVVAKGPLHLRDRALKRAFDIAVSLFALILLSPALAIVAIAIRWEDPGPALFRQRRIGKDNRLFEMLKFRSMYSDRCDADAEQLTKKDDVRVTRVGRFIRKTSIDELPQLMNVLRGEMSIVGPRPHAISAKAADKLYWDVDPRYRHRHPMKPGLTGLAQTRGFRGPTDRTEDLTNRLSADLEYVRNWSFWFDIYLIVRTLRVVAGRNAL